MTDTASAHRGGKLAEDVAVEANVDVVGVGPAAAGELHARIPQVEAAAVLGSEAEKDERW